MACEYLPTQTVTPNREVGVLGQGRAAEAQLISALHSAYRQGSQKSAGSATAEVYKFLGNLWLARVKDRLSAQEQLIAARCRRYCADGHRAALNRDIAQAGELLEAARIVLEHSTAN